MSSLLFLIVMDNVIRAILQSKRIGLTRKLMETLKDLYYTDEICHLAHTLKYMPSKCTDLEEESLKSRLQINLGKTKEMRINAKTDPPIKLDEKIIKNV
jgi:hypothetical protein